MSEKTHWKKLTNPDYLGAYAFDPDEEKTLTIAAVRRETVTGADGKKEDCTTVYWVEPVKPLILNVTNAKTVTKVLRSPYVEDWVGHRVILGVETVSAFGERVEAVRIKKRVPTETVCSECGAIITGDGKFTAAQIAGASTNRYGVALCIGCAKGRKEEEQK